MRLTRVENDARKRYQKPLDLKLVSVKFDGLDFALPTLSLGFWKSARLAAFFLALEPISRDRVHGSWCGGRV